jgi:hypothetical protein
MFTGQAARALRIGAGQSLWLSCRKGRGLIEHASHQLEAGTKTDAVSLEDQHRGERGAGNYCYLDMLSMLANEPVPRRSLRCRTAPGAA